MLHAPKGISVDMATGVIWVVDPEKKTVPIALDASDVRTQGTERRLLCLSLCVKQD